MRLLSIALVLCSCLCCTVGCDRPTGADDYESTVDAFTGQLVSDGKPIILKPREEAILQLVWLEKGERFGIPIMPDGTFTIGWMPTGEYSAVFESSVPPQKGERGGTQRRYTVPGGLEIVDGKTQYEIELGEGWKE